MNNLKQKGLHAFIWDLAGKFLTYGSSFIVTIFLARLLEPSDFGLVAMTMVVIAMAEIFANVGLGGALIQKRRVLDIHYSSVFYVNIVFSALLCLITYFSAETIANFYQMEELIPLIEVLSVTYLLTALNTVQTIRLRKELKNRTLTQANLVASLIGGSVGITLAIKGAGVWSLVTQHFVVILVQIIIIWTKSDWRPSFSFSWKALKRLWGFGFRTFLANLLETIYTKLDIIIIGKLFSTSTLGFYQRSRALNRMAIEYVSGSLMSVMFPVLSKVQKDLQRFRNIVLKTMGIICFSVFLLFGNLYLVSEEIIIILYTEKWQPASDFFKILALSGFAYPINSLIMSVLSSRGNSKVILKIAIQKKIFGFTNLGIGFLYGIEGYLYGLIIVSSIGTMINIKAASTELKIKQRLFYNPIVSQLGVAVTVVVLTIYIANWMNIHNQFGSLIAKSSFFTFMYFIVSWSLNLKNFLIFKEQASPLLRTLLLRFK